MFLHSNIKYLRNYVNLTQAEFGKLFGLTRANIDSYERGIGKPKEEKQIALANHFKIPLEVLISKDLKLNPGLLYSGASVQDQKNNANDDALKAKDETIRELKAQIKFLQDQNAQLMQKIKVA
jgi:transcriptional regulator with XRE-family HTH domain